MITKLISIVIIFASYCNSLHAADLRKPIITREQPAWKKKINVDFTHTHIVTIINKLTASDRQAKLDWFFGSLFKSDPNEVTIDLKGKNLTYLDIAAKMCQKAKLGIYDYNIFYCLTRQNIKKYGLELVDLQNYTVAGPVLLAVQRQPHKLIITPVIIIGDIPNCCNISITKVYIIRKGIKQHISGKMCYKKIVRWESTKNITLQAGDVIGGNVSIRCYTEMYILKNICGPFKMKAFGLDMEMKKTDKKDFMQGYQCKGPVYVLCVRTKPKLSDKDIKLKQKIDPDGNEDGCVPCKYFKQFCNMLGRIAVIKCISLKGADTEPDIPSAASYAIGTSKFYIPGNEEIHSIFPLELKLGKLETIKRKFKIEYKKSPLISPVQK